MTWFNQPERKLEEEKEIMSHTTTARLLQENDNLAHQRDQWRTIAIAYLVHVEKAGVHEKVFEMLTDQQKVMVKDALTEYLKG